MQGTKFFSDDQLKKRDIETLKQWFRHKFHFPFIIAVKDVAAKHRFFRGVRCPDRPNTITRISNPPPEKVTELQRLNRIGQPRFYCSMAAPAVFYELSAKQRDFIALSEWETTEPLWIHNLGFHPEAFRKIGAQDQHIVMRHQITNPIPNETKKNSLMRQRIYQKPLPLTFLPASPIDISNLL